MTNYLIEKGTNYSYLLSILKNPSFERIQGISKKFTDELPSEVRAELWEELNHGEDKLKNEALLSMYMSAYGKMHVAKLLASFENLPAENLTHIHIIDWGCGQAMATLAYYEYLRNKQLTPTIKSITLVEPSELSLKRAALHVQKLFPTTEIRTVHKDFNSLSIEDIQIEENQTVLHFFSNVLDIECFSIEKLAELIKKNKTYNFMVCVSPFINEYKNQRLYNFINCFPNANTLADYINQEWKNSWTVDYKVVEVNLSEIPDYANSDKIYPETVTDIDGNVYKTVKIGNQIWMAENLRVSRYRNGDKIPNVTDDNEWSNQNTGAWCNYDNDSTYEVYEGKLYNWHVVDDKRGLAPEGWHVPSEQEWDELAYFIDDIYNKNRICLENGSIDVEDQGEFLLSSIYESGFNPLEVGCRTCLNINDNSQTFRDKKKFGYWWSNTIQSEYTATYFDWFFYCGGFEKSISNFISGFSVRCIKDDEDDTFDIVWKNGLCGFRNSKGKMITPIKFENAYKLKDGLACVFISKKYGYINKSGVIIVPVIYDVTEYFMGSHDYDFYCGLTEVKQNNKYGFVNKKGIVKIPIIYDSVGYFNENLVSVCLNHKYGYLNSFGEIVVPLIYDFATSFKNGFGEVSLRGKYGFVNTKGQLVIPCKYDHVKRFSEGLAAVCINNKFGFINSTGELVLPNIFDNPYFGGGYEYDFLKYELNVFKNGECLVEFNNKFVAINKSGEVVREVDFTWYVE
jgi:uncharacterized protein (TIGR02145 family)